jgi:hypothetical protein
MVTLAVSLLGGMALGASPWGVEESLQGSWAAVPSNMLGWSYFLAWSISFYVSHTVQQHLTMSMTGQ